MATAAAIEKRIGDLEKRVATTAGVCLVCGVVSADRWLARLVHREIARVMADRKLDRAGAIAWIRVNDPGCAASLDKADLVPAPDEPIPCRASSSERRTIEQTGNCPACGQRVHWSKATIAANRSLVEKQIALVIREKDVSRKDAIAFLADCAPFLRPSLDALE